MHGLAFITDFGDQAVILPLAACVSVVLLASGWRRGALAWSAGVAGTLLLILLLKLGFEACGGLLPGRPFDSPSGHAAAAGVVYGGIAAFLVERALGRTAWVAAAVVAVVALMAASRVLLGAHSRLDAGLGAAIGLAAALLMVRAAGEPTGSRPRLAAAVPALAVLALFHGVHLPAEQLIRRLAAEAWPFDLCRR